MVYTGYGQPTAAIINDDATIVDYKLFWIACKDKQEAYYLLAIINSETLAETVNKYTTPNWAGKTRDLQKHLWKLPVPEFDPAVPLHAAIADAGQAAATGAAQQLAALRAQRQHPSPPSAAAPAPSPSPSPAANSANGSAPPHY